MLNKKMLVAAILSVLGASGIAMAADSPEMNGDLKVLSLEQEEILFTGKPFDSDLSAYVFNYRNFDPATSRWTSADPSGFPDGANAHFYAPCPTSSVDPTGLLKWSSVHDTEEQRTVELNSFASNALVRIFTVETNDGEATIELWKYISGAPTHGGNTTDPLDWSHNCFAYTFGTQEYWIADSQVGTILEHDYTQMEGPNFTGAKIAVWGSYDHAAKVTTVNGSGVVTKVTSKKGGNPTIFSQTPEAHWGGTPVYYE